MRTLPSNYGLIRAYADSDTACSSVKLQVWITEERYRRVMEMQEPQEYAQTQFSEERRQRVSQAKKRYNSYTENIAKVTR